MRIVCEYLEEDGRELTLIILFGLMILKQFKIK
jgi:hypothetical protein